MTAVARARTRTRAGQGAAPGALEFVDLLESAFLRALAEPARLEVLRVLLTHGPLDVGSIAEQLPQERSVVSRHLRLLAEAGILIRHRRGRYCTYALDGGSVLARFEGMLKRARALAAACCPASAAVVGAAVSRPSTSQAARRPVRVPKRGR